MTSQGNGFFYEIIISQPIRQKIKEFHQQAMLKGKGREFLEALRAVHHRLQQDPIDFGEPMYRLPALKLQVCRGIVAPMVVYFGIHEEKPLVFIQGVKLLT